jgi:hypothetical protein
MKEIVIQQRVAKFPYVGQLLKQLIIENLHQHQMYGVLVYCVGKLFHMVKDLIGIGQIKMLLKLLKIHIVFHRQWFVFNKTFLLIKCLTLF